MNLYQGYDILNTLLGLLLFTIFLVIILIVGTVYMFFSLNQSKKDIKALKNEINRILISKLKPVNEKTVDNLHNEVKYEEKYIKQTQNKDSKTDKNKLESLFGRNVVGFAAAILIFIGIIFLGILVYEYINEFGKILAMYIISTAVLSAGILLNRKLKNTFTQILTGCGLGCFFISILLTHIYFHKIEDITAFSLLLLWLIASLFASKLLSSLVINIVAHLGMITSLCFAYSLGLSDDKLILLLIYQFASIIVIIFGNILCYKETYRFGVFISLLLTIIASTFMWNKFLLTTHVDIPFATTLPVPIIGIAFIAQFVCAAFLSYLLSISTNKLGGVWYSYLIHIANKLLFIWALILNIYHVTYRIACFYTNNSNKFNYSVFISVIICLIILFIHIFISILISLKFNFNTWLENISAIITISTSFILLLVFYTLEKIVDTYSSSLFTPILPWFIILSILIYFAFILSKNIIYKFISLIILAFDGIFMIFGGYSDLNHLWDIYLGLLYMIVITGLFFLQWFKTYKISTVKNLILHKTFGLVFVELSLISIILNSALKYSEITVLIVLSFIFAVLYWFNFDCKKNKSLFLKVFMHINEILLLIFCYIYISLSNKTLAETILAILLTITTIILSFIRINELFKKKEFSWMYIWNGIKLTLIVLAIINGFTSWFEYLYLFSIFSMITALVSVLFGFFVKSKGLRLYGLIITLLCVIKLVTIDVSSENTILRVSALIAGGIICFAISGLYSYMEKRINKN